MAFLAKVGLMRIFLEIGNDKFGQILAARNFLQGHGISIDQSAACNLSEKIYAPMVGWPPGYSFLMMPFLAGGKDNFMLPTYVIDCATALVFFLYLRKTLLFIKFPASLANLFLVSTGLFINNYIARSSPTDFLGMTLLLAAVYYSMKIASSPILSFKLLVLLLVFSTLASLVRHQNFPVAILLLITIALMGIIQRRKTLLLSSVLILTAIGTFYVIVVALFNSMFQHLQSCSDNVYCGAGLIYHHSETGKVFQQYAASKGFFPSNLQHMHPFIIDSFINLNFYVVQLSGFAGSYVDWIEVAKVFNFPLLIILLIVFARFLFLNQLHPKSGQEFFWLFGGIAAAGVVGCLVLLSLTNDKNTGPPIFVWTFVMEDRYYAFPVLFIQIIVWQRLLLKRPLSLWENFLKWLLIVTITIEGIHGVYFLSKRISNPKNPLDHFVSFDQGTNDFVSQFIHEQKQKDSSVKVVVSSFGSFRGSVADWFGASGQFVPVELNTIEPRAASPTLLLIVLRTSEIPLLNKFLQNHQVRIIKQLGDYHFYLYQVNKPEG
jgi:hypothetical protein